MNSGGSTIVAPRVRLYVVDPRKFRKPSTDSTVPVFSTVDTPRFLLPKAAVTSTPSVIRSDKSNIVNIPMTMTTSAAAAVSSVIPCQNGGEITEKITKSNAKKKKPRKRKVERSNASGETENDKKLKAFLSTESTTRVGRLSKNPPRLYGSQDETNSGSSTIEPPPPKIKIREPPEVFRCQVCQKVYLGHTKLRLHYKTFPDHQIQTTTAPIATVTSATPMIRQNQNTTPSIPRNDHVGFFSPTQIKPLPSPSPPASRSSISVGVQVAFSPESFFQRNLFSIPMTPPRTLSRNSTSEASPNNGNGIPKTLSEQREITLRSPSGVLLTDSMLSFPDSGSQPGLEPITVPDLCLPTSMSPSPNQSPRENGLNTPNGFCESAFSSIRRVSSQNSDLHTHASHSPTIFQTHHHNLPVTVAVPMYQFNPAFTPPGDNFHNSNDKNPATPVLKAIWEFVEERMIQQGINQILAEISEVAERLSKIARDKFIPIREEEERLYCSSPIIQVDNPFLSNLLDLPFGTYVFREDAGVRIKPPPPPSAAELSLTGEVDVDKFLSPDILSLPHLTNIDFAAIL